MNESQQTTRRKLYIGIDNGVTGSICLMDELGTNAQMFKVPTISEQDYTIKIQNVTRLDGARFIEILKIYPVEFLRFAYIENPLVQPARFKATMSGIRCMEAQLICLRILNVGRQFIPPRIWQKEILGTGLSKAKEVQLKQLSSDIGKRLYPQFSQFIDKQKDADALLIAEWARRNRL